MAINEEFYGSQDTWSIAHAKSKNQDFEVKIPAFNLSNTTECYSGALPYKWGSQYDETESYNVENDTSFCYIAMDKDAPQLHSIYATITINSGDNAGHFYGKLTLSPENNVPFGWAMGTVRDYITVVGNGDYWHRAPINYQPVWYNEDWHPTVNVYSGQTLVSYLSDSAGDLYSPSPILSFPYRNIKLVPIIRAYALASGKTENDVKNAQTFSEFTSAVSRSRYCTVDLKTYLEDTYNGTPFYQEYPVIASIYCVPVLLFFDENGNLAVPTGDGTSKKYHSTAENTASWGTLNSAFYPMYFNESSTFDEIFNYNGTAYESQEAKECETLFFNPSKAPFAYVYYGYNGGTNPTGGLSIDNNGWGAFCVAGRAVESGNLRGDMYCRVIDNENWRTFWNMANGDCDCGNLISDYQNVNGFREYVRKIMAYFGMFFSDGVENSVEETSSMDTQGLFLGIVDENGITHGTYSEGTENRNQPNYDWEDPVDDTPWTPGGGGDDRPSDNDEYNRTYNEWNNSLASSFYNIYKFTSPYYSLYYKITDRLCNPNAWQSYWDNKLYNPISCIIVNHLMPSKLVAAITGARHVVAGGLDLTDQIEPVPTITDTYAYLDVGTININEYLKDFNDYSSTAIYIHLPYIGVKQLDTEAVMGGQLGITYVADCLTGDCLATVWVKDRAGNSKYRYEWKGNCSRPVYLSTYTPPATIIGSAVAGVVGGLALGAAGGLIAGAGASVIGEASAAISSAGSISGAFGSGGFSWMLEEMGKQPAAVGTSVAMGAMNGMRGGSSGMKGGATTGSNASGGSVSTPIDTQCYLIVVRPVEDKPSNYNDLFGTPSNKAGRIKDFSGFLSVRGVRLDGVVATEKEKKEINSILFNGIYTS